MVLHKINNLKIAVIGLGYVGLPLAVEFGKNRSVVGFDINPARIAQLRQGKDATLEISLEELLEAHHLTFTGDLEKLADRRFVVSHGAIGNFAIGADQVFAFKRAGCDGILTYFAPAAARILNGTS